MTLIIQAKKQAKIIAKKKNIKLKQALEWVAQQNNHPSWKSYKDSLDTFWYKKSSPFLNQWFVNYKQAEDFKNKNGGFLLTYKGQYFVAQSEYIEFLGLDPTDPVWKLINHDVSHPNTLRYLVPFWATLQY